MFLWSKRKPVRNILATDLDCVLFLLLMVAVRWQRRKQSVMIYFTSFSSKYRTLTICCRVPGKQIFKKDTIFIAACFVMPLEIQAGHHHSLDNESFSVLHFLAPIFIGFAFFIFSNQIIIQLLCFLFSKGQKIHQFYYINHYPDQFLKLTNK